MSDSNDGLAVAGSLLLTGAIFAAALDVWGGLLVAVGYLVYVAAGLAVWRAGWLSADYVCYISIAALIATMVGMIVWNTLFGVLWVLEQDGLVMGFVLYLVLLVAGTKMYIGARKIEG